MKTILCIFLCLLTCCASAQQRAVIGFYNVENLYDTINDPTKNDDEYTPEGPLKWNTARYHTKLRHLGFSISCIGNGKGVSGPDIIGLCEIENASVLADLVRDSSLKKQQYAYVLIEGPDVRGVDVALLYKKNSFEVESSKTVAIRFSKDTALRTRDILVVKGKLFGEEIAVLVNHWPSRRGGETKSRENRNTAARMARRIADSLEHVHVGIKIIIMGDFNDDPINASVKKYIRTYAVKGQEKAGMYFNAFENLYSKGIGTLAYKDNWNLFDQLVLNQNFWVESSKGWKFEEARVHNLLFLRSDYGNFKGYPFRSYSGGIYTGGYSDHFASYIFLRKN